MIDVTAAVMRRGKEIFIARRALGKHLEQLWEFPGGKLEHGEDPRACLQREMKEEFGIDVAVGVFIGESVFDYGEKVVRLLAYAVEHLGGEIVPKDHDSVRWVTANQLGDFDWAPADLPFVERLIAEEGK
jgi:8-oxo-dGTP diphosphatase